MTANRRSVVDQRSATVLDPLVQSAALPDLPPLSTSGPCRKMLCDSDCAHRPDRMVGTGRRTLRLVALVAAIGLGVALIAAATVLPGRRRERRGTWALQHVSRWVLRSVGVRLEVKGSPRSGPSLVVGNHTSWLDILALSASSPMRMVAKSEVARWPVVGAVATRIGTLFLHRDRLRELPQAVAEMGDALRSGVRVQVFPEGTTRCGTALNVFRRAAFQAAIDAGVVVSPVAVSYADRDGGPLTSTAFVGDETLMTSLRRVIAAPSVTVTVRWLRPIPAIAGTGRNSVDRATVARLAENAVARSLRVPVIGRPVERRDPARVPSAA